MKVSDGFYNCYVVQFFSLDFPNSDVFGIKEQLSLSVFFPKWQWEAGLKFFFNKWPSTKMENYIVSRQ